jgi:redox-sensing transcriptional repressor
MPHTDTRHASGPTLRRLPHYHRLLRQLRAEGRVHVSSRLIARRLGAVAPQVRKDLAVTSVVGRPKVGYDVAELIEAISAYLGWRNAVKALLAGVGSLGTALLGYEGFRDAGLDIVAAFDVSREKIGTHVHGVAVYPLSDLPALADRMGVRVGVLTVPAEAAQPVANLMVAGGIRGIWNFAPARLDVPADIVVEDVSLSSSLAVLSGRLNHPDSA